MYFQSKIVIRRSPKEVWKFLADPSNITKWDRGVVEVKQLGHEAAVGMEFETYSQADGLVGTHDRGRMCYRVAEIRDNLCRVKLTSSTGNARFFKDAEWTFRVDAAPEGSQVTCSADFSFRFPYQVLAPLLYVKRDAILTDLHYLRQALEQGTPPQQP
jgi:Polyketide cyclase / dehydrase and lipid transport